MLPRGAGVEKAGPARAAEPLVAVAGVEVGADFLHVQVKLPWRVRAVDHGEDPSLLRRVRQISSTGRIRAVGEVM